MTCFTNVFQFFKNTEFLVFQSFVLFRVNVICTVYSSRLTVQYILFFVKSGLKSLFIHVILTVECFGFYERMCHAYTS